MKEIEVRGPLGVDDTGRIQHLATLQGWQVDSYRQVTLYCDTSSIPTIGPVNTGSARVMLDIRNDSVKLKIKIGDPLGECREEFALRADKESLPALLAFLELFGISDGFLRTCDRTDYRLDSSTSLTIKLDCIMGDHFELEVLSSQDRDSAETKLAHVLSSLSLTAWSREQLAAVLEKDHKEAAAANIRAELSRLGML